MFDTAVQRQVGTAIHRLIAAALRDDVACSDVDALVKLWWNDKPLGGTTASQTRTRATLAVTIYLRRLHPQGWVLLGNEVRLPSAVADLVFGRYDDGELVEVFIDEIKTGRRVLEAPELPDQVARLTAAGQQQWPGLFNGVRTAELARPSRVGFWAVDDGRLTSVAGPALKCGEVARRTWPSARRWLDNFGVAINRTNKAADQ